MDLGVIFGLSGMAIGLLSLVYARTQALNAKRQADAAHRAATMEIQDAMLQRINEMRSQLVNSPAALNECLDSNPGMRELYRDSEYLKSTVFVRNGIDNLQDIYFLRKTIAGRRPPLAELDVGVHSNRAHAHYPVDL